MRPTERRTWRRCGGCWRAGWRPTAGASRPTVPRQRAGREPADARQHPGPGRPDIGVTVPALPGCVTRSGTLEEAIALARDAIRGYLEALAKDGRPIPEEPAHPQALTISVAARWRVASRAGTGNRRRQRVWAASGCPRVGRRRARLSGPPPSGRVCPPGSAAASGSWSARPARSAAASGWPRAPSAAASGWPSPPPPAAGRSPWPG
jgi:antitoxin HicB